MKIYKVEKLEVEIHMTVMRRVKQLRTLWKLYFSTSFVKNPRLRVVFAAAPSQNEMLKHLTGKTSIPWSRIIAFHMDEYIGLNCRRTAIVQSST